MRKYLSLLFICAFSYSVFGQQKVADSFPYQKYPIMPAFEILMLDSAMVINTFNIPKGKSTVLMYFSPDCNHCEMVTDSILAHITLFKDTRIFLFSPMQLSMI